MWVFFALLSRFLWSAGGMLDQVLTRAHLHHRVLSVLTLQMCTYLPFSLMACYLSGHVHWSGTLFLWVAGALTAYTVAMLPYYKALQAEQSYNIVPYFELTPVFLTILVLTLRHEHMSPVQLAAALLVISCGFAFSWDFKHGKVKERILALMGCSAFIFGLQQFCIKSASVAEDAWTVTFYYTLGQSFIGWLMFAVFKPGRKEIIRACKATAGKTVLFAAASGGFSFLAFASLTYAFKIAPSTGHVAALSGTQPLFSFLLAAILGHRIPQHFETFVLDWELKLKLLFILGIFCGIYILTRYSG
jgi:drug/metabolite transporter (DMT)-like permease